MAQIDLRSVTVEFPIYNVNARSFKKKFLRTATGGAIVQDANQHIVVKALKDVTLTLRHGDRLGLIGHNGAGKSTLLRLLAGIYEPTAGDLRSEGRVSPMLSLLHGIETEFTGYENIMQRGILLGLSRSEVKSKIQEIADFSGLGDYLAMPMRTYSSGMMVRLTFAISLSIQPEILLLDEVFNAGDADFVEKAQAKMKDLLNQSSIVVMASHLDELLLELCNKILWLDGGQIRFLGKPEEALALYHREIALDGGT